MQWPDWINILMPWLWQIAALALLSFWVIGAHSRLTRLRHAVAAAWGQIDELLTRRAALLEPLVAALREPMASEAATLDALMQAEEAQHAAARVARLRPHHAPALLAWAQAESGLASPLARLDALIDLHPEWAANDAVRPLRRQWRELAPRLAFARQVFNETVTAYNTAAGEFPTRLLRPLLRFAPAAKA